MKHLAALESKFEKYFQETTDKDPNFMRKPLEYPVQKLSLEHQEEFLELINTLRAAWFRRFSQKNSSLWLPYQHPSYSAHCARELFSGSNRSASLVDCT